jgi:hypothetical protein
MFGLHSVFEVTKNQFLKKGKQVAAHWPTSHSSLAFDLLDQPSGFKSIHEEPGRVHAIHRGMPSKRGETDRRRRGQRRAGELPYRFPSGDARRLETEIIVDRTPLLKIVWSSHALKAPDLNNVSIVYSFIAQADQKQFGSTHRFFRTLGLMAKNRPTPQFRGIFTVRRRYKEYHILAGFCIYQVTLLRNSFISCASIWYPSCTGNCAQKHKGSGIKPPEPGMG